MNFIKRNLLCGVLCAAVVFVFAEGANAQKADYVVLTKAALTRVVPTTFYFAGQIAPTQMRNAAAARVGKDRFIIAGLVDTSGYSTEIAGKYEGFFITDSPVRFGDETLETGAYGFGFTADGKVNVFDLGSKEVLSTKAASDASMKRPRPLQMTADANGVRLYKGKNYVLITPK